MATRRTRKSEAQSSSNGDTLLHSEKLSKWPTSVRWALAYPAAILFGVLVYIAVRTVALFAGIHLDGSEGGINVWFYEGISLAAFSAAFVYTSVLFTPKYQRTVAIISMCIIIALSSIMAGLFIVMLLMERGPEAISWMSLLALLAGGVIMTISLLRTQQNE